MNYLAHAHLSFHNPDWLAGNMISDFVKGKQKEQYAAGVRNGIILHRAIDHFTDNHSATHRAKQLFKADYRLYSGAFVDIVFDHFLATDKKRFPDNTLEIFSQWVYNTLDSFEGLLPEKFARMLPFMRKQDWLLHYNSFYGMERSFEGLARRALYIKETHTAFTIFLNNYEIVKDCYEKFIDDVEKYAREITDQFPPIKTI